MKNTLQNYSVRLKKCKLTFFMLIALSFWGCDEAAYGPSRQAQSAAQMQAAALPAKPSIPAIIIGAVSIPMPAPDGFKRAPNDSALARAVQGNMTKDEVLLCIFEKSNEGSANADLSQEGLMQRDLLLVSTLNKWLDAEVSSLDFLKLKQPWQDGSTEFNQSAFVAFEEAVKTRLAEQPQFSYNLGMIDSGSLHISFLKVVKHTGADALPIYTCSSTSLLWRYGKILSLNYSQRINDFSQIQSVVAESVGYIQKLQALDRSPRGN